MIKSSIEKFADAIGFEIGTSDDITQSELLNGLCRGLNNSILHKSDLCLQLCYIADNLNEKSEKILLDLAENIKCKNTK